VTEGRPRFSLRFEIVICYVITSRQGDLRMLVPAPSQTREHQQGRTGWRFNRGNPAVRRAYGMYASITPG